jgi:hypothetical protein
MIAIDRESNPGVLVPRHASSSGIPARVSILVQQRRATEPVWSHPLRITGALVLSEP